METARSPRARLALGSFWTVAGTGMHMAASLGASIAVARILGAKYFGEVGLARTMLTTFTLLAGANLGVATARAVSALHTNDRERTGRLLGLLMTTCVILGPISMTLCALLSGVVARALGEPHLAPAIAISSVFILFAPVSAVQIGALNGFEAFSTVARQVALEGFLMSSSMIAGAYFGGVAGAMTGIVVAGALAITANAYAVAKVCRANGVTITRHGISRELPIIRTLVVPSLILAVSSQPFVFLARGMLARVPNGMIEVAVFSAAFPWGAAALMIPTQIARPAMPILSNLLASGELLAFRRLLRDTLLASAGAAALVAFFPMVLSPWILRAYGPAFSRGAIVLVLVAVASIAGAVSSALRSVLVATGDVWSQAAQAIMWGLALIASFVVLRRFGAPGLGGAYLAAYSITLCVQVVFARRAVARAFTSSTTADLDPPVIADAQARVAEIE